MKIELRLTEIVAFLRDCYNVNIELKYVEKNKIKVKYLISADITIKDIDNDIVTIIYEVNGVASLLAKGVNLFFGKKIDEMPIEWNSKTNEVIINLKEIEELKALLKFFQTTDILLLKDSILVQLNTRSTTE